MLENRRLELIFTEWYDYKMWTNHFPLWKKNPFRLTYVKRPQLLITPVNPKGNQPWIFIGKTDVEVDAPIFCSPDANGDSLMLGKILRAEEEGVRGWDGWMTSPMQWTWTWANFWGTERLGMLQSVELQKVRHYWMTEEQQVKSLFQWTMFLKDRKPKENKPLELIQFSELWIVSLCWSCL